MKKRKRLFALLFAFLFLFAVSVLFTARLNRAAEQFVSGVGSTTVSLTLQNALYRYMRERPGKYTELTYDGSGRVTALAVDAAAVSLLASELSAQILREIRDFDCASFGIPLGNLFPNALLSGRGPLIPVRPVVSGNAACSIGSDLQSAGINQALHRVLITFDVSLTFLTPFEKSDGSIRFDVVVSETLIVGEVPILYRE